MGIIVTDKYTKRQVNYSTGHIDSHCGKVFHDDKGHCKHYRASTNENGVCDIVEGQIKPMYWCKEWEKAK